MSGEVTTGQTVQITLDVSAPVTTLNTSPGTLPQLLLNDGATATYDAAHSTSTALVFDYTVGAGDVTTDLAVSGDAGQHNVAVGTSPIFFDGRGVAVVLTGAGAPTGLQVNTTNSGTAGPGTGSFTVPFTPGGGTSLLEIFGPSAANLSFTSGSPGEAIKLDDSAAFTGTVAGLAAISEQLDLADIGFSSRTTLGYTPNSANTGGTLIVSDGTRTANIALLGQYMASSFATANDDFGGTLITDPPAAQQAVIARPHHT
jgi:hypothetical protein